MCSIAYNGTGNDVLTATTCLIRIANGSTIYFSNWKMMKETLLWFLPVTKE
jgi:hypothetical protein